jgi:peptidoglycan/xylan/chitin deacetylase (PgdA/CDA1 family)
MRRFLTRGIQALFPRLGVYGFLRRRFPNPAPAILRLHSVAGPEGRTYASPGIRLSPAAFERMIRYLSRRYTISDMDELSRSLASGSPLPPNSLVLTFDDGYRDNLEAARALARCGLNATFYITLGRLRGMPALWLVEVRRRLLLTRRPLVHLEWGGRTLDYPLRTLGEREAAIAGVTSWMKTLTVASREEFLGVLIGAIPLEEREDDGNPPMLSWDEVRLLDRAGMRIGGHTLTHCNLVHATEEEARAEIGGCVEALSRELPAALRHFAYPNGGADAYYDERAKALLRAAGFETAVTSSSGCVRPGCDPLELPRIGVTNSLAALIHDLEWWKLGAVARRLAGERGVGPGLE